VVEACSSDLVRIIAANEKSPPALSPAGFGSLISLADLHQAMTVRRHGITVMVVMAVMVAELHCFHPKAKSLKLSTARWLCRKDLIAS
jgi:hypothetical protein